MALIVSSAAGKFHGKGVRWIIQREDRKQIELVQHVMGEPYMDSMT